MRAAIYAGRTPAVHALCMVEIRPLPVLGSLTMSTDDPPPDDERGRVLRFRQRASAPERPRLDLRKFEGGKETGREADDYRHRMIINVVALVFVALLVGAGLWLANSMAQMRKNQDCVLSGRRNCAPVDVNRERW